RAVTQRAGLVDTGKRATTGSNGQHLDTRKADRIAVLDGPIVRRAELTVVGQPDICTRTTHVQPDRVLKPTRHRDLTAGNRAGGNAGRSNTRGAIPLTLRTQHSNAGMKQHMVAP